MKKGKEKKAMFSQRLGAFLLDIIIVSMLSSMVTGLIPTSDAVEKLYEEQNSIMENYVNKNLDMEQYVNQLVDITYDISKETAISSIISIVFTLLFFVVYPFYHNGQTIGKQVLKIKVRKSNETDLTMNDLLFRSMINNSIFLNIVLICLVFFTSKDAYLTSSSILSMIQYVVMIISLFMIAFSSERKGLHDRIVHTEVVCVNTVKEKEEERICES